MGSVSIRRAQNDEVKMFYEMEQLHENAQYVMPYSFLQHRNEISKPEITYLSITDNAVLIGFMILCDEPETGSVEFRRIIISKKGKGIGQEAISQMEVFCKEVLFRQRIWLDVFEQNKRGLHIYQKLGYQKFHSSKYKGRILHFYEKDI